MFRSISPKHNDSLLWLDLMKAVALIWIFLNHTSEKLFGSPYFANPDQYWPAITDRIQQLSPIAGHGYWNIILTRGAPRFWPKPLPAFSTGTRSI